MLAVERIRSSRLSAKAARREYRLRWHDLPLWSICEINGISSIISRTPTMAPHMQSAFWIVDRRCAIAIVVRPLAAWSRASCTTFSEFESNAEVASSSRRTFGLRSRARAMAIRSKWEWVPQSRNKNSGDVRFWPPESWDPFPPTSVSKPLITASVIVWFK